MRSGQGDSCGKSTEEAAVLAADATVSEGDEVTVDEICDLLAKELPDGFLVEIHLEKGYGGVWLEMPTGEKDSIETESTIGEKLLYALQASKEANQDVGDFDHSGEESP